METKIFFITNPETEKFVQFAYNAHDNLFVCDIPIIGLTKEEEKQILLLLGAFCSTDANTGEKISFQQVFNLDVIDGMTILIENIFTTVFSLVNGYKLEFEIELA